MNNIYFFTGLGADCTVFDNLKLPGYQKVYIDWIKPYKREALANYAKRLVTKYEIDSGSILAGLSFGGMLAVEVAKVVKPRKTFLISSIKTFHERPVFMIFGSFLKPNRLISSKLAVKLDWWFELALGKLNPKERDYVKEMAERVDPDFTDWAADSALSWRNKEIIPNLVHIHGDSDNLFPNYYLRDYERVAGGTHFMVYNKAGEVSNIMLEHLRDMRRDESDLIDPYNQVG